MFSYVRTSIDQFGDHLLERSHVPMRICCHVALVGSVCHALSHDVSVRSTTQPPHHFVVLGLLLLLGRWPRI